MAEGFFNPVLKKAKKIPCSKIEHGILLCFRKIFFRVEIEAVIAKFKMKMCSGGISCGTHGCNYVTGFYFVTDLDKKVGAMGIERLDAVSVVDDHMVSKSAVPAVGYNNCAVGYGMILPP